MLSTLPGAGAGETKDEVGLETELSKSSMAVGADAVVGGADSSGAVAVVGDGAAVGEVGTVGGAEAVGDVGAIYFFWILYNLRYNPTFLNHAIPCRSR